MAKLFSYMEECKVLLLKNRKSLLFAPPGCGMDRTIVATLKDLEGTKLIVDAGPTHSMWKRLMEEFNVHAELVTPEKAVSDSNRYGIEYMYDTVVWNVVKRGKMTLATMAEACNNAENVIIRRLEYSTERRNLLKDFKGKYHVVSLIANTDGIYPLVNKNFDSAAILKRLGKE